MHRYKDLGSGAPVNTETLNLVNPQCDVTEVLMHPVGGRPQ
jgi:hypothetical protein